MKKALFAILALLVIAPLGMAQDDESYYAYSFARLSYVSGDVFVQRTSDLGYEKAEINLALVQGDKIGTENGQAEIHFGRRNYLRIDARSQVEFALLPREGEDRIKLHILEGSVYLRAVSLPNEKDIEIHTPDASFYVLEEGLYRVDVRSGRETELFVHEGSAEAAGEEGSVLVRTGERLGALDGRFLGEPEYFYERLDGFDEWNKGRDGLLAQRSTTRYLPSDLYEYEEELDRSGRWVYESPYGYVWTPYGVHADWRPYFYGRWVWYPIIGWTWVSSEPWGWSVYHYGRWHWRGGLGWYWIPHHHWRPAWVHWWWDHSYVGWCPLGWHNRPVVIVNNSFYDRHYDRYSPIRNRALTVVRRNQLQAPDVGRHLVKAEAFGTAGKIALKAQQPAIRPVANKTGVLSAQAQKTLSRPGFRSAAKNYTPAEGVSAGRLRSGSSQAPARSSIGSSSRNPVRSASPENPAGINRESLGRSSAGVVAPTEKTIRTYPRSRVSSSSEERPSSDARSSGLTRTPRSGETSKPPSSGVGSAKQESPPKAEAGSARTGGVVKKNETESSGNKAKSGETIKKYAPSASVATSVSSGRATVRPVNPVSTSASRSYPSRMAKQTSRSSASARTGGQPASQASVRERSYPSSASVSGSARNSSGSVSSPSQKTYASPSRPQVARQPSRSSSPTTISRGSASRSTASSQPRASVSRPSSSRASSPRSVSAPRSSAPKAISRPSSKSSSSSSSSSAGKIKKKD